MIEERKKYWIDLFIKKCTSLNDSQEQLDHYFEWCEQTYNVSESYLNELKKKYTVDEYINRFIPIVDKYFTIENIKEIIKFYSTDIGKKMIDYNFLKDFGQASSSIGMQIEQDFAMGNNKDNG